MIFFYVERFICALVISFLNQYFLNKNEGKDSVKILKPIQTKLIREKKNPLPQIDCLHSDLSL